MGQAVLNGSSRAFALTPEEAADRWERKCDPSRGCKTQCCFFEGSPCENLRITNKKTGKGVCRIYTSRFGKHQTLAGKSFRCVPMYVMLKHKPAPSLCGYADVMQIDGVPVVRGQA